MTLEEAIVVLNRERHRGDRWYERGEALGECSENWLTEFEAIAIAEKYEALANGRVVVVSRCSSRTPTNLAL